MKELKREADQRRPTCAILLNKLVYQLSSMLFVSRFLCFLCARRQLASYQSLVNH